MSAPQKFRKKPVEIEAIQWDGTSEGTAPIIDWVLASGETAILQCSDRDRCAETNGDTPHVIAIRTLEGTMAASLNDWVIRGVKGEFYPCKPDIFEATYETVAGEGGIVVGTCWPDAQVIGRDVLNGIRRVGRGGGAV